MVAQVEHHTADVLHAAGIVRSTLPAAALLLFIFSSTFDKILGQLLSSVSYLSYTHFGML